MRLNVRVIPKSSMKLVQAEIDGSLKVKLTAPPEKGKANKELIEVLAAHYKIHKSKVKIVKGATSKDKVVEIEL
jgi:uncharacterized protein (TIGR00251 family)